MAVKRIWFLSDLHIGSYYGLMGDEWISGEGNNYSPNKGQKYLIDCWRHMLRSVSKCDYLIFNGDVIDGRGHPRKTSFDSITTNVAEQSENAIEILTPLRKRVREMYFIRGTPVHDQESGEPVEYIAKSVGAKKLENGAYSTYSLFKHVGGHTFQISHKIGTSQVPFYRATQFGRELMLAGLLGRKEPELNADIIVRGHNHYYMHLETTTQHAIALPCFQLQTPYMTSIAPFAFIPRIGAVVVELNDSDESCPVKVMRYLYGHPRVSFVVENEEVEKKIAKKDR